MVVRRLPRLRPGAGFTLIELLVVVSILGLLLALMVPAAGALDDHARKKATQETFAALRTAILGPEGLTDPSGRRVVGGFVGEAGRLPRLYAMAWNPAEKRMAPVVDAGGDTVTTTDRGGAGTAIGDSCGQPLALWMPEFCEREGGRRRAYLSAPVDVAPEDGIDEWDPADPVGMREFRLREGAGRLVDGWGRALLVFVDTTTTGGPDTSMVDGEVVPRSLVFVSAGPDGSYVPDPANLESGGNEDNLVMRVTREDWNRDQEKIAQTNDLLDAVRTAILGRAGVSVDGTVEPNGFVADIGGVEPLTGSYVSWDGGGSGVWKVYRCAATHVSSSSNPPHIPSYGLWEALGSAYETGKERFPKWEAGRKYHAPSLDPLVTNSVLALREGALRRSIEATSGAYASAKWIIENAFAITDSSRYEYDDSPDRLYDSSIIGGLRYDADSRLSMGWSGPYLHGVRDLPVADAWGVALEIEQDTLGDVVLRSRGPDTALADSDDDLVLTIRRAEFLVPLTVEVAFAAGDTVKVLLPHDGRPAFRWFSPTSSGSSKPFATVGAAEPVPAPTPVVGGPSPGDGNGASDLPIGRRTIRFKDISSPADSASRSRIALHSSVPHATVSLP